MKTLPILLAVGALLALWAGSVLAVTWYIPKALAVIGITAAATWSAAMGSRAAPNRTGQVLVAFCMALNLFLAGHLASGLPPGNLWVWLSYLGGVAAGPLFYHLAARFPVPDVAPAWTIPAAYGLAALAAAAQVSGLFGQGWLPTADYANEHKAADHLYGQTHGLDYMMPGLEFVVAGLVAGAAILWLGRYVSLSGGNRTAERQAQIVLLGMVPFVIPFLVFLPGLMPEGAGQFMALTMLFCALLPLAVSGAMTRPDLYDPRSWGRRLIVWTGATAGALLSYLLLVRPLGLLLDTIRPGGSNREAAVFVAAFAVALLVRPLQLWLERQVDRLFFPERINFRQALEEATQALATTISAADLQRVAAKELPERLRAACGLLLVVDGAGQNMAPLTAARPLLPPEHPVRQLAEQARGPSAFRNQAMAAYLGVPVPSMLIPLYVGDHLVGAYFLGLRESGETYSPEELRRLTLFSHSLSVAVENVRGYRKIDELNRRTLAEVEERNHIAREIHDTLAQGLTGIALQFEIAQMFREAHPAKADRAIARGLELARSNLEHARRSVLELRASLLGGKTLPEALAEAVQAAAADQGARGEFHLEGAYEPLPTRVETALYRIAQEALHNTVKYAGASHLEVVLRLDGGEARLIVQDDGAGFDPGALPDAGSERGGFGLTGMRERARLVGGVLHIQSLPGAGTRVTVQVPLLEVEEEWA